MKNIIPVVLFFMLAAFPALGLADDAAQTAAGSLPGVDLVGSLLDSLPDSWGEWVTLVVTVCAAIAVVLPTPKESSNIVWRGIYWLVQVLALNKGRAANAQDVQPTVIRRVG